MKVSIITPSYNQEEYIGRTIESILSQQGDFELEYLIIDGQSKDKSVEIIKSYAAQDDRIQWVSEPDNGQSDAINKGLKKATGDIVAFLNSDDIYYPGTLQKVVEAFTNKPASEWLTGYCQIIDDNDKIIHERITAYKNFFLRHYSYAALLVLNFISQPATFWRRSVLNNVGYINEAEHLVMDYEYWCRIGKQFHPSIIQDYLSGFRITPNTKSSQHTTQQFKDEARIADQFTRNPLLRLLHRLHFRSILLAYKIVR